MTDQLKQEILSTLTPDFFPCKISDLEEFVMNDTANVSNDFFIWAVQLANEAEEDDKLEFVYKDVYELFPDQIELMKGHNFFINKNPK